jgi:ABC-type transport system substrate-binding protein
MRIMLVIAFLKMIIFGGAATLTCFTLMVAMATSEEITVALPGINEEYDPSLIWVTDQWFVLQNLGITLLGRNQNGYYGRAAKSWKVNKDESEITITLRDDLRFSNGDKVTSKDVSMTLKRLILLSSLGYQLKNTIVGAQGLTKIDQAIAGIVELSTSQIRINFTTKFVGLLYFLTRVEFSILHHEQIDKKTLKVKTWSISSGPYSMERDNKTLLLKRNSFYNPKEKEIVERIRIVAMQQQAGYNALKDKAVDIVNFGAVFNKDFGEFQKIKSFKTLDTGQMSSCYFQFNERKMSNFPLEKRIALSLALKSYSWLPYKSDVFEQNNQLLSKTMMERLTSSRIQSIESAWNPSKGELPTSVQIFYPEFFGNEYLSLLKKNFEAAKISAKFKVVPISDFMNEFENGNWDLLFTMMEMPSADIRALYTQLFAKGGMKISDPMGKGHKYLESIFSTEENYYRESSAIAEYIHGQALVIPLFQTGWPYYVREGLKFESMDPYELDFKLWKLRK